MREFWRFVIDPMKSMVSLLVAVSAVEGSKGKKNSANAIYSLRYIKHRFDPLVYH